MKLADYDLYKETLDKYKEDIYKAATSITDVICSNTVDDLHYADNIYILKTANDYLFNLLTVVEYIDDIFNFYEKNVDVDPDLPDDEYYDQMTMCYKAICEYIHQKLNYYNEHYYGNVNGALADIDNFNEGRYEK